LLKLTHSTIDIAIVCSNFKESLHFYQHCLGLEIVMELEIPAEVARGAKLAPEGFRQVRLQAGNTLIKLMDLALPPASVSDQFKPGVRWLTFFVEDIEQTVSDLEQKGVTFLSPPVSAPDAAGVVCAQDPDGILIEFVQV
jgi:glyoxylase I family protein